MIYHADAINKYVSFMFRQLSDIFTGFTLDLHVDVINIWYILWHIDPLLGNDRERSVVIQQSLLSNDFANKHVSTAIIAQQ
jgi:hypothetical protein